MPQIAITAFGHDRPGIIAELTGKLAGLGLNIEDSTMTLLRGHFAMMLIVGTGDRPAEDVMDQFTPGMLASPGLSVSTQVVRDEPAPADNPTYLLSVHGGDRPGIVSAVLAEVAAVGGNITDLSTRLAGDLYVLTAEVDLPTSVDPDALTTSLRTAADDLGVDVSLLPLESDDL